MNPISCFIKQILAVTGNSYCLSWNLAFADRAVQSRPPCPGWKQVCSGSSEGQRFRQMLRCSHVSLGGRCPSWSALSSPRPPNSVKWAAGGGGLPRGRTPASVSPQSPPRTLPSVGPSLPWMLRSDIQGSTPGWTWFPVGHTSRTPKAFSRLNGENSTNYNKENRVCVCGQTWPPKAPFRKRLQGTRYRPSEATPSVLVRETAGQTAP